MFQRWVPPATEAATLCDGGCNPMWWRLQPYVMGHRQLLLDHIPTAQGPLVATAQGVRQSAPG
eukprot:scaffold106936_cov18-Phaeocystis_antarctica.AAC.1